METPVIKIGNSKGLRLSAFILDKYDIGDKVELILEPDKIIIKPIAKSRVGWDKAFEKMAADKTESLLIDDVFEDDILEEWS